MDPRVSEIFTRALEVPDAARQAFVSAACGQDQPLVERVRQMLADAHKADEFFGSPSGELGHSPSEDNPEP